MAYKLEHARMCSDQKNWSDTYLTDPALVRALGPFSVDPACPPHMPWETARRMMHEDRFDGLTDPWGRGRAWMNPPYRGVLKWAQRFVEHGSGVCLLNGRANETQASQLVLRNCAACFFPAGRLVWYGVDGGPKLTAEGDVQEWFGSVLMGMTEIDARRLELLPDHGFPGAFLKGPRHP